MMPMIGVRFKCGCGEYNYTRADWLSHWRHGRHRENWRWHAIRNFLLTQVEFVKS